MTEHVTTHQQIRHTYLCMAFTARYRPAAPSDGMGNITFPLDELVLHDESEQYARKWQEEEDSGQFRIGLCNYSTRPSTIYAIEAARVMCGGSDNNDLARRLLRMALAYLDETHILLTLYRQGDQPADALVPTAEDALLRLIGGGLVTDGPGGVFGLTASGTAAARRLA